MLNEKQMLWTCSGGTIPVLIDSLSQVLIELLITFIHSIGYLGKHHLGNSQRAFFFTAEFIISDEHEFKQLTHIGQFDYLG